MSQKLTSIDHCLTAYHCANIIHSHQIEQQLTTRYLAVAILDQQALRCCAPAWSLRTGRLRLLRGAGGQSGVPTELFEVSEQPAAAASSLGPFETA
jgi:hypothetical protein